MTDLGIDALCVSVGPDLPYLTGYEAMPLERLTMLVVPRDHDATLVVPRLEAPRVVEQPDVFSIDAWEETDDPIERVVAHLHGASVVAIGDHTWARFVLALQAATTDVRFGSATDVTGPLRVVKDAEEIDRLRDAGRAVDEIAIGLRDASFAGRTEHDLAPRDRRAPPRRRTRAGQLRHRRERSERGQPAPRPGPACHRAG